MTVGRSYLSAWRYDPDSTTDSKARSGCVYEVCLRDGKQVTITFNHTGISNTYLPDWN